VIWARWLCGCFRAAKTKQPNRGDHRTGAGPWRYGTPGKGGPGRAGYLTGASASSGSKRIWAVDHLSAISGAWHVTPANVDEPRPRSFSPWRGHTEAERRDAPLPFDQGYTGEKAPEGRKQAGVSPRKSVQLGPKQKGRGLRAPGPGVGWLKRSFAWATRWQCGGQGTTNDNASTLAGLHIRSATSRPSRASCSSKRILAAGSYNNPSRALQLHIRVMLRFSGGEWALVARRQYGPSNGTLRRG